MHPPASQVHASPVAACCAGYARHRGGARLRFTIVMMMMISINTWHKPTVWGDRPNLWWYQKKIHENTKETIQMKDNESIK